MTSVFSNTTLVIKDTLYQSLVDMDVNDFDNTHYSSK